MSFTMLSRKLIKWTAENCS